MDQCRRLHKRQDHWLVFVHRQTHTTKKQTKTASEKTKTKTKKERTRAKQQADWSIDWENCQQENSDKLSVHFQYKKYTVANRKIVLKQPMREIPEENISYNLPELSKIVNLAQPGEESKPVKIAQDLTSKEESLIFQTLKEYRGVFAWTYKDLKGVDPTICQHTIPMKLEAKPVKLRPYTYNETFANKIKAEIDRLIEANFIYEIEHT